MNARKTGKAGLLGFLFVTFSFATRPVLCDIGVVPEVQIFLLASFSLRSFRSEASSVH